MRMNWLARLKTFLSRHMLLCEFCRRCGRQQPLIWWCADDALWERITGWKGNGILCPECFDKLARDQHVLLRFLAVEIKDEPACDGDALDWELPQPGAGPTSEPKGGFRLNEDRVPATIEEAAKQLADSYDEEGKEYIRSLPLRTRVVRYPHGSEARVNEVVADVSHFTGMHLRNSWSLWEPDSPIKLDAVKNYSIAMADDLSMLIFEWSYALVRGEHFDPQHFCHIFHAHWARSGMTSLEAGGWPPKGDNAD